MSTEIQTRATDGSSPPSVFAHLYHETPRPLFSHLYHETYQLVDRFRIQSFDNFAMHLLISPEPSGEKRRGGRKKGRNRGNGQLNGVLDAAQAMEAAQVSVAQLPDVDSGASQAAHPAQTPGPPMPTGLRLVRVCPSDHARSSSITTSTPELFKYEFDWTTHRTQHILTRLHPTDHTVEVFLGKKWHPLTTYLHFEAQRNLANPNLNPKLSAPHRKADRYLVQQDWWLHNGKNFPLMHLPPEVRDVIYGFCVGEAIEPYARDALRLYHSWATSSQNHVEAALLRCHARLGREVRDWIFRHRSMLFKHQRFVMRTLQNRFFPRDQLKYVTLAFPSFRGWIRFFGFRGKDPKSGLWCNEYAHLETALLSKDHLPNLKCLELVLPDRETLEDTDWLEGGCQVGTVELVLKRVLPVVDGQPVVLAGMVKRWQKKKVATWVSEGAMRREGWVKDKGGQWVKGVDELEGGGDDDDDDEEGGVPITEEHMREHVEAVEMARQKEVKAEPEPEPGKSADDDDGNGGEDDEYDELAELPIEELPPVCRCDPPCLVGDWVE